MIQTDNLRLIIYRYLRNKTYVPVFYRGNKRMGTSSGAYELNHKCARISSRYLL